MAWISVMTTSHLRQSWRSRVSEVMTLSRGKKRTRGNVWIPRALCEPSVEIDVLLWVLDDAFVGCGVRTAVVAGG